ncbi:hypothetical protein Tco_1461031, partial [Tanacetum coccineum]
EPFLKWDTILASLDEGGLGVGSLKVFSLALLQKWRWRPVNKPVLLWVRIIKAIHGMEAGFSDKDLLRILMHELSHIVPSSNSDSWTWSMRENGVFYVAATRLHIDHGILLSSNIRTRWNKKAYEER